MKLLIIKFGIVVLTVITLLSFISCNKEDVIIEPPVVNGPNKPPVANAGEDIHITYPTQKIILNASGSVDPEGVISKYSWRQLSGPVLYGLQNFNQPSFEIYLGELGIYELELQVTDMSSNSDLDTLKITFDAVGNSKIGTIIESGTRMPVEGIEIGICIDATTKGCIGATSKHITDSRGEISFKATSYAVSLNNLNAKGYWNEVPGYERLLEYNGTTPSPNHNYNLNDSFHIVLVPKISLPVRVKDSRQMPTSYAFLSSGVIGSYAETNFRDGKILLRPGIDTVMTMDFYGSFENRLLVNEGIEDVGIGTIDPVDHLIIYDQRFMATRTSKDTIYIKY